MILKCMEELYLILMKIYCQEISTKGFIFSMEIITHCVELFKK